MPPVSTSDGDGRSPDAVSGRWKLLLLIAIGASISIISDSLYKPTSRASAAPVSIIVPTSADHDEHTISRTVAHARRLQPPPLEVIVVDASSTGHVARLAAEAGGRVITAPSPGLASQLNRGAAEASGSLLAFLPPGARPPADLVAILRHELSRPTTLAVGFRPAITDPQQRPLWLLSTHSLAQSLYLPLLTRPLAFVRGLRLLSSQQLLCCRKDDFDRVSQFSEAVDLADQPLTSVIGADLCMRLHGQGLASAAAAERHSSGGSQGRIKLLLNRDAVTTAAESLSLQQELLTAWGQLCTGFQFCLGRYHSQHAGHKTCPTPQCP